MLAYRHLFHAGNFADVFKHVLLTRLLIALTSKEKPFCDGSHKTCGFIGDQAAPGPKKMPEPPPIPEELK